MMRKYLLFILINTFFINFQAIEAYGKVAKFIDFRSTKSFIIAPEGTISYEGNPFVCPGITKVLRANSPTPSTYQWLKNSAIILNATSSTYTVTEAGEYSVRVQSGGRTTVYPAIKIEVLPYPEAKFTQVPTEDCSANRQFFTNESVGDNLIYEWDFGDPNSDSDNKFAEAYGRHYFIGTTGNGTHTFTVTLKVTNQAGCSDVIQKDITLKQSPNAKLTANGSEPEPYFDAFYFKDCSNQATTFTFKNESNTNNISYTIDWGDGQPAFTASTFTTKSHTYQPGKIYELSYTVRGTNGCFNNRKYRIMVGATPSIQFGNLQNNSIATNDEISIPVIGAQSNTIGTLYKVKYGDSPDIRPTLPLTSVKLSFPKSSYGKITTVNGLVYQNAYSASIQARNVCGNSPFSFAGPIYVSDKQEADFVTASECICLNETKDFSYADPLGFSVTPQGQGYQNKIVWKITPATGYIITSGSLGTDNSGNTNPYTWTSGTSNLNIQFIQDGQYTVSLYTGTGTGIKTISKSVCVKPLPTVNKPADQNICEGSSTTLVIFTGNLDGTIYNWKNDNLAIGLAENGSGNIPSFTANNNTNSISEAIITVTPSLNGCTGIPQTFKFIINPGLQKPVVNAVINYCIDAPATALAATIPAGNTLKWFTDPTLTNGRNNTPTPSTNTAGTTTYYVIQVNSSGCESPASKIDVIVNPEIVNNAIVGSQSLCYDTGADALTQASGNVTGGDNNYVYQWQSSIDGATWSDVTGANQRTYSPGQLTSTLKYRRQVTSGTCIDFSNEITIHIQNAITNYNLEDNLQVVEPNQVPAVITGQAAQGGSGTFTYQWETSSNGTAWSLIIGATSQNYQPSGLLETAYFRRIIKSGICNVTSNRVAITVYKGIKNTFTPNGDGINDTWDLAGFAVHPNMQVQVFNRSGQIVFQGRNQAVWDGEYQGNKLPVGVYYYSITENNAKPITGWVSIIY
jgi:gliding motility-associated-like protein